jgi:hypothetical protein
VNHTNRTANGALVSAAEIARMKGSYPQPTPHTPQPFVPCIEARTWAEVAALVSQYHTDKDSQCSTSCSSPAYSSATAPDASMPPTKHDRNQSTMQEYPNEVEAGALDYAGKQAAAFIESIAKTDLATFSAQDWLLRRGQADRQGGEIVIDARITDAEKALLAARADLDRAIDSVQAACPHSDPVEIPYHLWSWGTSDPPQILCRACGYWETGWQAPKHAAFRAARNEGSMPTINRDAGAKMRRGPDRNPR